jgi:cytochrome c-type biogenesis protein CcmH
MRIFLLLILLIATAPVLAVEPNEMLHDPALESRAREIGRELRCLVCQNQSIDDSDADLAHDLRILIRERLQKGDSDAQVEQYIVARYGDYVLLKPLFKPETALLWLGPAILLLAACTGIILFYRCRTDAPPTVLSAKDRQRVEALLEDKTR